MRHYYSFLIIVILVTIPPGYATWTSAGLEKTMATMMADSEDDAAFEEVKAYYDNARSECLNSDETEVMKEHWGEDSRMYALYVKHATSARAFDGLWEKLCEGERNGTAESHPNAAETLEENIRLIDRTVTEIGQKQHLFEIIARYRDGYSFDEIWNNTSEQGKQAAQREYEACIAGMQACEDAFEEECERVPFNNSDARKRLDLLAKQFKEASDILINKLKNDIIDQIESVPSYAYSYYDVNGNGRKNFVTNHRSQGVLAEMDDYGRWMKLCQVSCMDNDLLLKEPYFTDVNGDGLIDVVHWADFELSKIYLGQAGDDFKFLGEYEGKFHSMDFNNDGRPNLFTAKSLTRDFKNTLTPASDGRLLTGELNVVDPGVYVASNKGGGLIGSSLSTDGWFVSSAKPWSNAEYFGNGELIAVDFNGDGLTDYLDYSTGTGYLNTYGGQYVRTQLGGNVVVRDFNGDGLMDFVVYAPDTKTVTCYLQQADGTMDSGKVLYRGFECGLHIWCYDFNRDGAVDILIPFGYRQNNGSYLLLMENKGDGTFRKHETFIKDKAEFAACVDIDADGCYEVLAYCGEDGEEYNLMAYKVMGNKVNDQGTLLAKHVYYNYRYYNGLVVGDFDNTGLMRAVVPSSYKESESITLSDKPNTRPSAPDAPTFFYDIQTGLLKVNWGDGRDVESAAADLTYELRIGTTQWSGDVVYAHALQDGTRRNLLDGNQGYAHQCVFDTRSWPEGKLYIAVQAIDANHLGSPFSAFTLFEKESPAAMFAVEHSGQFGIGDEADIVLLTPAQQGVTYEWELDGATVVSRSDDDTRLKVVYNTPGDKHIALKAQGVSVGQYTYTLKVSGHNIKFDASPLLSDTEYKEIQGNWAADMDLDGKNEVLALLDKGDGNVINAFLSAQNDGNYEQIRKLWNTRFKRNDYMTLADFNRDGLPDIFCVDEDYNQPFALINNGELDFDEEPLENMPWAHRYVDLNNDGLIDCIQNATDNLTVYMNRGNHVMEKTFDINDISAPEIGMLHDYNHDGLIDLIAYHEKEVWLNNGDGTFTNSKIEVPTTCLTLWGNVMVDASDLDGDGLIDFVVTSPGGSNFKIEWGDGTCTSLEHLLDDVSEAGGKAIGDYDNDGYPDIVVRGRHSGSEQSLFLLKQHPDRQFTLERIGGHYWWGSACWHDNKGNMRQLGYGTGNIIFATNTAPAAPTHLRSSQTGRGVVLEWNHSVDKETPACHMRYIVSVKRKGIEGEGAYIISPMNGGRNGIPVPTCRRLVEGNRFFIPIGIIPAGEYEVSVQGVDLWNEAGDFSEPYTLHVEDVLSVDIASSTVSGEETPVTLLTNTDAQVDWADGTAVRHSGNTYYVIWPSEGMRQVGIGGHIYNIYVNARPDASFTIPERVMAQAWVNVKGESMAASRWNVLFYGSDAKEHAAITAVNENQAAITFDRAGEYTLTRTVKAHGLEVSDTRKITVTAPELPAISLVDTDPNTGCCRVNWNIPASVPAEATSVNLYRETTVAGEYTLLGNFPLADGSYVDMQSNPRITSSTYAMSYELGYGESAKGTPHTTMHATINVGIGGSWNIIWTPYRGIGINTYRILRGTSEDNLSLLAEVSGSSRSYSDLTAATGTDYYYAVEVVPAVTKGRAGAGTGTRDAFCSRSNVVSTHQAQTAVLATGIEVISLTGSVIDADHPTASLAAIIAPYYASVGNVAWTVVEGVDNATVDEYGTVTPTGKGDGQVVIRAATIDGTDLSAYITLSLQGVTGISAPAITADGEITIGYDGQAKSLTIKTSRPAVASVYTLDGMAHSRHTCTSGTTTVGCASWPAGVYVIDVKDGHERKTRKIVIH